MIDLSRLFRESDGESLKYKGHTIAMWNRIPITRKKHVKIKYNIISTNSEWVQGFAIRTDGELSFDDVKQTKKNEWIAIWENKSPAEDIFNCESKNGLLEVKNIWDTGNGCIESWNNGAAMWYEEIPGGRRYHCNDGHFDDDFDDIIFEIVILDGE